MARGKALPIIIIPQDKLLFHPMPEIICTYSVAHP
jgi:hypothetical protein